MISKEAVKHIAKLARIELSKKEEEKFTKDLSSILDYVEQLNKVDTKNIESIKQITGLEDIAREDKPMNNEPQQSRGRQRTKNKILKGAPKRKGDYFQVPKILE